MKTAIEVPEINQVNYDHGDVLSLNEWALMASAEIDALRTFKQYVHDRLDGMKVPDDPYPQRTEDTGCRIGSRLNYVEQRLADGEYSERHACE